MRIPFNLATDSDIRDAHHVYLVDPKNTTFRESLAGDGFVPPFIGRGSEAFEIRDIELEVDSNDQDQLQAARLRVQEVRHKP